MPSRYQPAYGIVGAFLAIMLLALGAAFLGAERTRALQTDPPAPTPTINPALTIDLRVDNPTKYGDRNTTVRFTFSVTNNRCPGEQVYIRVSR